MPDKTLKDLAQDMKNIDIAMLSTHTAGDNIAGRPMSNNGQVEYDGTSYYFTFEESRTVSDIEKNDRVSLTFQGERNFLVAVEGRAVLSRDRAQIRDHWSPDLDKWFKDGIDTPDIVMVRVDAERVQYWDGEDGGEVKL